MALAAVGVARAEAAAFGTVVLEPLVLAIVLGAALRTAWRPSARWTPGVLFSGKVLLEVAIALLGASVNVAAVGAAGARLLLDTVGVVAVAILASYAIGRAFGLSRRLATLVACGNGICGNSAIAAVAPVIGAECGEVAASISYTALLGVVVVLALPLLGYALGLAGARYGVLAGLTVYAVPQVLAATAPMGALALQVGTVVKLTRVMLLGPVVLALSLVSRRTGGRRIRSVALVPWFVLGFAATAVARAAGALPEASLPPTATLSGVLTIVSMAALGLGMKLPRFRGVMRSLGCYGSAVTFSVAAS